MKQRSSIYHGRHFPSEIIAQAVYLYHRFTLSLRDVEGLLAMREISVSYETIRVWCAHYGPTYAKRQRKRCGRAGDIWLLDEVYIVTIQGKRRYLWRAIDQDGDTIDILVQKHKDKQAAMRFFRTLLRGEGGIPNRIVTDKLKSYAAAKREIIPDIPHCQDRYANNRVWAPLSINQLSFLVCQCSPEQRIRVIFQSGRKSFTLVYPAFIRHPLFAYQTIMNIRELQAKRCEGLEDAAIVSAFCRSGPTYLS